MERTAASIAALKAKSAASLQDVELEQELNLLEELLAWRELQQDINVTGWRSTQ